MDKLSFLKFLGLGVVITSLGLWADQAILPTYDKTEQIKSPNEDSKKSKCNCDGSSCGCGYE